MYHLRRWSLCIGFNDRSAPRTGSDTVDKEVGKRKTVVLGELLIDTGGVSQPRAAGLVEVGGAGAAPQQVRVVPTYTVPPKAGAIYFFHR